MGCYWVKNFGKNAFEDFNLEPIFSKKTFFQNFIFFHYNNLISPTLGNVTNFTLLNFYAIVTNHLTQDSQIHLLFLWVAPKSVVVFTKICQYFKLRKYRKFVSLSNPLKKYLKHLHYCLTNTNAKSYFFCMKSLKLPLKKTDNIMNRKKNQSI